MFNPPLFPEKNGKLRNKINIDEIVEYKEPISDFYLNNSSTLYKAEFFYNATILYETHILAVDEFRKFIVLPKTSVYNDLDSNSQYYYYLFNSLDGKLLKILTDGTYDLKSREYYDLPILFFKSEDDRQSYIEYARANKENVLENEIADFKKLIINAKSFNNKHDSYIKSYILYMNWMSGNN